MAQTTNGARALLFGVALAACGGQGSSGGATTTTSSTATTTSSTTTTSSSTSGSGGAGGGGGAGGDPCAGQPLERHLLTVDELHTMLTAKDFALVNVHVPDEGEIVGTDVHIPYTDVPAIESYLGHQKGARAVLYCFGGSMSTAAGDALVANGYCQIYDLTGGLAAWMAAGYPYNPPQ